MKKSLVLLIFGFRLLNGQVDSNSQIGVLNNPELSDSKELMQMTVYLSSPDRSQPTLMKLHYKNKDTIYELVYDTLFKGTEKQLFDGIQSGAITKYYVIEKDRKLYERIKIVEIEESFFDEYWIYIAIFIFIVGFGIYKLNIENSKRALTEDEAKDAETEMKDPTKIE